MTIYQCPECGSTDLQFTQWVHLNKGHAIEGDGPLDTIWCEGCQEHQKGADAVYGPKCLCEACANPVWDECNPIEGAFVDGDSGAITRCDECRVFDSDESAAYALSEEMTRRGFSGFVRATVDEYEPGEMGEYGPNYYGPDYKVSAPPKERFDCGWDK